MYVPYKSEISDIQRQMYSSQLETFSYIKEDEKKNMYPLQTSIFQNNLNRALSDLIESYEHHNEDGIEYVFEFIGNSTCEQNLNEEDFRVGLIDIFKYYNFPNIVIDLMQTEIWQKKKCSLEMLSILISCEDEEIICFLIDNNLIQIINSCIISSGDSSSLAIHCLSEFIRVTEGQYQEMVCNTINFENIIPFFYQSIEVLFDALFFLSNVIHFFNYIPYPEQFVSLLKEIILLPRNAEEIISYTTQCLIEMIRIDRDILNLIFDSPNSESNDLENADLNIFLRLYDIYLQDYINLTTKNKIVLLFVIINRSIDSLIKEYQNSIDDFLNMKKIIFKDTFVSYEPLKIAKESDDSVCISMVLELLSSSIKVSDDFQKNLKKVYKIIEYSIKAYNDRSFKLKGPSLKLLLSFIEVYEHDLDVLRFMRDNGISLLLIDSILFDNKKTLEAILNSILIIVRSFQNSVESDNVKSEFSSLGLEEALDEFVNIEDERIYFLLEEVRNDVYNDLDDFDN